MPLGQLPSAWLCMRADVSSLVAVAVAGLSYKCWLAWRPSSLPNYPTVRQWMLGYCWQRGRYLHMLGIVGRVAVCQRGCQSGQGCTETRSILRSTRNTLQAKCLALPRQQWHRGHLHRCCPPTPCNSVISCLISRTRASAQRPAALLLCFAGPAAAAQGSSAHQQARNLPTTARRPGTTCRRHAHKCGRKAPQPQPVPGTLQPRCCTP